MENNDSVRSSLSSSNETGNFDSASFMEPDRIHILNQKIDDLERRVAALEGRSASGGKKTKKRKLHNKPRTKRKNNKKR